MEMSVALVSIMGLLVSFGLPLALVVLILAHKRRKLQMAHDTVTKLAEQGLPVPPELLEPPRRAAGALRGGLVLVALGIALAIFLTEVKAPWSIALIPGLMGVALLLSWLIERRSSR